MKSEYSSYKDLPVTLYQVQTKYRDEARPRAGILRGREFVMKDSYSFDVSDEGLQVSYDAHRVAYQRIFERLGMTYVIVSAVSGAMGGSASEEFLAPAPTGEDTYVACRNCDYAANVEAAQVKAPEPTDPAAAPALEVLDTPDTPTIETLVALLHSKGHDVTAGGTLKNVVVQLRQPGEREVLVIGVPGDREVDMKAVEANVFPAELEPFEAWDDQRGRVPRATSPGAQRAGHPLPRGPSHRRSARPGSPVPTRPASTPSMWCWVATSRRPAIEAAEVGPATLVRGVERG